MWEKMKEHAWNWFGIAGWSFLFAHLVLIAIQGEVTITEENPLILYSELIVVPALIILGIRRDIKDWRSDIKTWNKGGER